MVGSGIRIHPKSRRALSQGPSGLVHAGELEQGEAECELRTLVRPSSPDRVSSLGLVDGHPWKPTRARRCILDLESFYLHLSALPFRRRREGYGGLRLGWFSRGADAKYAFISLRSGRMSLAGFPGFLWNARPL